MVAGWEGHPLEWEDLVVRRRVVSVWEDRPAEWVRHVALLGGPRPKLHLRDKHHLFNPPPTSMGTETALAQQGPVQKD